MARSTKKRRPKLAGHGYANGGQVARQIFGNGSRRGYIEPGAVDRRPLAEALEAHLAEQMTAQALRMACRKPRP